MSETSTHHYRGNLLGWPAFLGQIIQQNRISAMVLFGQGRTYHQQAIDWAHQHGIQVYVMEEGYFRPGYVTFEQDGVNDFSRSMHSTAERPLDLSLYVQKPAPEVSSWHFAKMALHATLYYTAMWWGRKNYPYYQHHRVATPWTYAAIWLRSWMRKGLRWHSDQLKVKALIANQTPYFFVPLQCPEDSQIHLHSRFDRIEEFITEVIESFARCAPDNCQLLFKQHPMSRGETLYDRSILRAAQKWGVLHRVHFVTEAHNPTVIEHAQGMVIVNSTMGLQALARGKPVKALGDSFFNCQGLADQQELDTFWAQPLAPGPHVQAWLLALKCRTQIPASIYALASEPWKALS